jgi:hypothetical protein
MCDEHNARFARRRWTMSIRNVFFQHFFSPSLCCHGRRELEKIMKRVKTDVAVQHNDGLFKLSMDVLVTVTSFLDSATLLLRSTLVCTKMNSLVRDRAIFHIDQAEQAKGLAFPRWLVRNGQRVRSLDLPVLQSWHLAACPFLERIQATRCSFTDLLAYSQTRPLGRASVSDVDGALLASPNVRIRDLPFPIGWFKRGATPALDLSINSHLTSLNVSYVDATTLALLTLPPSLQSFSLYLADDIRTADLRKFFERHVHCPLRRLDISGWGGGCPCRYLYMLTSMCPHLQDLVILIQNNNKNKKCTCSADDLLTRLNKLDKLYTLVVHCGTRCSNISLACIRLPLLNSLTVINEESGDYPRQQWSLDQLPQSPTQLQRLELHDWTLTPPSSSTPTWTSITSLDITSEMKFTGAAPNWLPSFPSLTALKINCLDLEDLQPYLATNPSLRSLKCLFPMDTKSTVEHLPVKWLELVWTYARRIFTQSSMDQRRLYVFDLVAKRSLVGIDVDMGERSHGSPSERAAVADQIRQRAFNPLLVVNVYNVNSQ